MANVKFFMQGNFFYFADKGGAVFCCTRVSAITDVLNNICRTQNVPHGPNDSNLEIVDKILKQCGGYDGDPNSARVTVKLGKMIDAPIATYHILRTESGEFHILSYRDTVSVYNYAGDEYWADIIDVARRAGIQKFIDLYNEREEKFVIEGLDRQYNVYEVFCEIYDFINSRK